MAAIPRRRLTAAPDLPHKFQPGNEFARRGGRPPGKRNKTTNLVVAGITAAVLEYGAAFRKKMRLPPDADLTNEVENFKAFMLFVIDKDLRGFLSLIKGLIPKDVTLTITQQATLEVIAPDDLAEVLEQRGLRLPPQYALTAAHKNDDDPEVSEAEIAKVVEGK